MLSNMKVWQVDLSAKPISHSFRSVPRQCFREVRKGRHAVSETVRQSRKHRDSSFTVYAQQNVATQIIGGGFGGPNEIFVAGADGQLGIRIVQKLLQAGFKVIAGVPDKANAQAAVDFAASAELLKKQEAQKLQLAEISLNDESSIASALPKRGARLLAVLSDSSGKGSRLDTKAASRLLQAAQGVGASQFILVSPSGSGTSGGGFLGNLFGGGGGSGSGSGTRLSKLEQELTKASLDFIVIRTAKTGGQDPAFESSSNVELGPQGSLPKQTQISRGQIAQVVQQVVRQGNRDLLVEAWASASAPAIDIQDAVSEVLPSAAFEREEIEIESQNGSQPAFAQAGEDEPTTEVPKTPGGLFGGFGTRRVKVGSDAPESIQQKSSPKPKKSGPSLGRKKQREAEDEQSQKSPVGALGGLFGGGKKNDVEISPEKARKSAVRGAKAAGKKAQKAAPVPPGASAPAEPKKGFLASIGLGGESKYVDDED